MNSTGEATVDVVVGRKGGVGKSTITVNLAAVIGENTTPNPGGEDSPVVAAGIDPQGSIEKWADRVEEDELPFDYLSASGDNTMIPSLCKDASVKRIIVDTPGFMDVSPEQLRAKDPLGVGEAADALRAVLDVADRAIVPITTEWLSWDPVEFTIERVLRPRGIPFLVVINLWDPRDGREDLDKTIAWVDAHEYRRAPMPIRRYKIHTNAAERGLVVTRYPSSGTALRAREDFYKLALALDTLPVRA